MLFSFFLQIDACGAKTNPQHFQQHTKTLQTSHNHTTNKTAGTNSIFNSKYTSYCAEDSTLACKSARVHGSKPHGDHNYLFLFSFPLFFSFFLRRPVAPHPATTSLNLGVHSFCHGTERHPSRQPLAKKRASQLSSSPRAAYCRLVLGWQLASLWAPSHIPQPPP